MATQTYASIQSQIRTLTAEAARLRAAEVAGVVAKIKEAVTVYGIEPSDIFGPAKKDGFGKPKSKAKRSTAAQFANGIGGEWVGRGPRPRWLREAIAAGKSLNDFAVGKTVRAVTATTTPVEPNAAAKTKTKAKNAYTAYADKAGNSWSGRGPRPAWFKEAIANGETPESLKA